MSANRAANAVPQVVRQGPQPLNPERPPQLLGKYAKTLGTKLDKIVIEYDADGVSIGVYGKADTAFAHINNGSIADFKSALAEELAPSDGERLMALRNKFELRLNKEFPKGEHGPASGSEADIQGFMSKLPFRERRALLMTQKQFSVAYPNGFTQA